MTKTSLKETILANSPKKAYRAKSRSLDDRLYIFCSFDLVNSTAYKSLSPDKWVLTFSSFFELIKVELSDYFQKSSNKFNIWKYLGDEILLYKEVRFQTDIFDAPVTIKKVLQKAIDDLSLRSETPKDSISVKSTLWLAKVSMVPESMSVEEFSYSNGNRLPRNLCLSLPNDNPDYPRDFIGPDIDIGFRIAKLSFRGRLILSANYAYYLHHNSHHVRELASYNPNSSLRIAAFRSLKGIWHNRQYPIILFETKWNHNKLFRYDEPYFNTIVKNIKSDFFNSNQSKIKYLDKVYDDLGIKDDLLDFPLVLRSTAANTAKLIHN